MRANKISFRPFSELAKRRNFIYPLKCCRNFNTDIKSVAEVTNEGLSTRSRVLIFTAVIFTSSVGAFSWKLSTDNEFLVQANDISPRIVRFLSPFLGLPVSISFDSDEAVVKQDVVLPEEIKDIVGEKIKICCLTRSRQVFIVEASPDDSIQRLQELVRIQSGAVEEIVNYEVINQNDTSDLESLKQSFQIKIPEIPETASPEVYRQLLLECQVLASDLQVQIEVNKKYNNDNTKASESLSELTKRINVLEQKFQKKKGWFW